MNIAHDVEIICVGEYMAMWDLYQVSSRYLASVYVVYEAGPCEV